jgi:hypothetical protein
MQRLSLDPLQALWSARGKVRFHCQERRAATWSMNQVMCRQVPGGRRYVAKNTPSSRAQVACLIGSYQQGGYVNLRVSLASCLKAP